MRILHLGKPTPGDPHYYDRWKKIGNVSIDETNPDIIVTDQYTTIDELWFTIYPNVKVICSPTTGHTHLDFDPDKFNVKVITLRDEVEFMKTITSVSEFTIHLIMRCARDLSDPPLKLSGKSIGIIGKGRVGSHVGAICEAMGMKVKYFDKEHNRHYLKSIFRYSDFVSIHLSENEKTKGMINGLYLQLMRPSAFLINTARSSIVDENYLRDMILRDKIAGIASDVSSMQSPINIYHPKVILTRHIGGRCLDDRIMTDNFIIDKLKKHLCNNRPC